MDANDSANKNSEGNEEQKEIPSHFGGSPNHKLLLLRMWALKVAATEGSEGNEYAMGN